MSIYPLSPDRPYGESFFGGTPRSPTLDRLVLVPPSHLPHRLREIARLGREPLALDVRTEVELGGLSSSLPLVVSAMGGTPVAHRHGLEIAQAAAREGVPLVLGENIATVHGYSERKDPSSPSFKERILAYLHSLGERGGVVVQQSVEDAMDELWWRVYTDPQIDPFVQEGRVGFEIKVGQGAKPGLGGITLLSPSEASRLSGEYRLGRRLAEGIERFSAPGTFTFEILEAQIRHLRNDFPPSKIWVKLPPTRDAVEMGRRAAGAGADLVTFDGAEGGTALAPTVFLEHVGLPTLALLKRVRSQPPPCDILLSGGLRSGADVVKVRALGLHGVGMGRTILEGAIRGGLEGARERLVDLREEVQMIVFALGHLDVSEVGAESVYALDRPLAHALGVCWIFDDERIEESDKATPPLLEKGSSWRSLSPSPSNPK